MPDERELNDLNTVLYHGGMARALQSNKEKGATVRTTHNSVRGVLLYQ